MNRHLDDVAAQRVEERDDVRHLGVAQRSGRIQRRPQRYPKSPGHQKEWIDACKGKSNNVVHGVSSKTHCDFDYSGTMIEQMLLGLVEPTAGRASLLGGIGPVGRRAD